MLDKKLRGEHSSLLMYAINKNTFKDGEKNELFLALKGKLLDLLVINHAWLNKFRAQHSSLLAFSTIKKVYIFRKESTVPKLLG